MRNPFSPRTLKSSLSPTVSNATTLDTQFVSMIAHEMRAPLATIRGAVGLLTEHHDRLQPDRRSELLEVIDDATIQVDRVIQDLMVLSRLNDGELSFEPEPLDLVKIVRDAARALNSRYPNRTITIAPQDDVPDVRADAIRTRQIVNNLIANAIGYSEGSTDVIVSIVTKGNAVRTSVYNEGHGIAPSEQSKLFLPFAMLAERTAESTGLGLFIAKGLVEAMNGDIGFTSEPGENAVFWFSLPIAAARAPHSDDYRANVLN